MCNIEPFLIRMVSGWNGERAACKRVVFICFLLVDEVEALSSKSDFCQAAKLYESSTSEPSEKAREKNPNPRLSFDELG